MNGGEEGQREHEQSSSTNTKTKFLLTGSWTNLAMPTNLSSANRTTPSASSFSVRSKLALVIAIKTGLKCQLRIQQDRTTETPLYITSSHSSIDIFAFKEQAAYS